MPYGGTVMKMRHYAWILIPLISRHRYLCTSIRESAKSIGIVEHPNTLKYLVFLGIHHLSVRDLDEIISIGKIQKWRKHKQAIAPEIYSNGFPLLYITNTRKSQIFLLKSSSYILCSTLHTANESSGRFQEVKKIIKLSGPKSGRGRLRWFYTDETIRNDDF